MALTLTEIKRGIIGTLRYLVVDAAFDASYESGGEPLTPATLGMTTIHFLKATAPAGYVVSYDYTNQVLHAYRIDVVAGDGTQGVNVDLMKSATATLEVTGDGTAFQVALGEVTATNDMSTDLALVSLMVYGE